MGFSSESHYRNRLLEGLTARDLALIEPSVEHCDLPLRMNLERLGERVEYAYFIETGMASVVAKLPNEGGETEIGLIGFEGMTGSALVLGDQQSTHACYVQLAGTAFRISAARLANLVEGNVALRVHLLRYARCLGIQTGFTALANARLNVEERLARWLLMCSDRASGNKIRVVHEFLAIMLGVRRPGVTVAIQMLEGRGLVHATRGEIVICDRAGLLELSKGCYGGPEDEYERLIGQSSRISFELGLEPSAVSLSDAA